jgi:hypothetical protein
MVASMLEAVGRALRERATHAVARRRDPLAPRRSDRQKFIRGDRLTERQVAEIDAQHRAEAERDRAPFPARHIGADGVPRP